MNRPVVARVLVGALAALVVLNGAWASLELEAQGFPRTAAVQWLVAGLLGGFLLVLALAPAEVESLAPARSPLDLRRGAHYGALVAAAGALYVVLGLAGAVDTMQLVELRARGIPVFDAAPADGDLVVGLLMNAVVLVGAPILWLAALYPGRPLFAMLGLTARRAVPAFMLGTFFAVVSILLVAAVMAALTAFTSLDIPVNERAVQIARSLTPWTALLVAVGSSVTEEIFFRGWLQPRVGVVVQALVFTVAHLNYLHVGQTVAVFVLGLLFGFLYRGTRNLWAPIGAHFAFNLVMLLAAGGT